MNSKKSLILAVFLPFLLAGCLLPGASATPTPTAAVTPLPLDAVVLAWSRVGGIAGFCDMLTITADGRVVATTCESSFMPEPEPLSPQDWGLLQAWLAAYGPYSDIMSDGAVADSMTVTLDFFGYGPGEAGEMEMQSLMDFAGRIFFEYYTPPATPTAAGPCVGTANSDVTVYQRPSTEADVFGTLGAGESIEPMYRSTEGWYGFDPGVAQAGNVGVFRMRWVPPDADITWTGGCDGLPIAPVLSPTACYTMALAETEAFEAPDPASQVIVALPVEGFAAAVGQNAAGWVQVDLNDSSQPQDALGWVDPADLNFNGDCGSLPQIP